MGLLAQMFWLEPVNDLLHEKHVTSIAVPSTQDFTTFESDTDFKKSEPEKKTTVRFSSMLLSPPFALTSILVAPSRDNPALA